MEISLDRFPDGKQKALTMSYDDGIYDDIKLVEIFNKYGIKGTFHVNGGLMGDSSWSRLTREEVAQVYQGHEISGHGYKHQRLSNLPDTAIISEIIKDRESLEPIIGKPLRGMSYPMGDTNERVKHVLRGLDVAYSRVAETSGSFEVPEDFLEWKGTCHHNDRLIDRGEEFISMPLYHQTKMLLMYVWGHSYEFSNDGNWGMIEEFCKKMSGNEEIWYATNMEICEYIQAVRALKFTANQDIVQNPSAINVWISVDQQPVEIKSGKVLQLSNLR